MRHYVLTRSAFGRQVSAEENRHRLELLRRVTVPSMAAQTNRDVVWIVLLAADDPLVAERRAAFESAGLPLVFGAAGRMIVRGQRDKPYGPWKQYIRWGQVTLTTRLDDDDAFAPEALERVRHAAERANPRRRVVWQLTDGYRIFGPMAERLHWPIPMFCTLQAPAGDRGTIMDVNHLGARRLGPLQPATADPMWLWVRHAMTRSSYNGRNWALEGYRYPPVPVTDEVRAAFPIDWPFVEALRP